MPRKRKYQQSRVERFQEKTDADCAQRGWTRVGPYVTATDPLDVRCHCGHVWPITPTAIRRGGHCPECFDRTKGRTFHINELDRKCAENGGKRIGDYINGRIDVQFECKAHHQFWTAPHNVMQGTWCSKCSGMCRDRVYHEELLDKICAMRGGERLTNYISGHDHVRFRCAEKHEWWAAPNNIKREDGTWCPTCAPSPKDPAHHEQMLDIICQLNGGKRLDKYVDSKTQMKFVCAEGHEWHTTSLHIKAYAWCPICSKVCRDSTYHEVILDEICAQKGGQRLSPYVTNREKMEFCCAEGHKWETLPGLIKGGAWCPNCKWKSEGECRLILETVFGKSFAKIRPEFLRYGGHLLELDGYCEELKIAFEFNGQQHYDYIPFFHDDEDDLQDQLARDHFKETRTKEMKIDLIIIPYWCATFNDKVALLKFELGEIFKKRLRCESDLNEVNPPVDDWWP